MRSASSGSRIPPAPFSVPIDVAALAAPTRFQAEANAAECAALAKELGVERIARLAVRAEARAVSGGIIHLEGCVEAEVWPICVISLDPFAQSIEAPFALDFAPEAAVSRLVARALAAGQTDFEPPDPIIDGRIDLGAVAGEFLALSLDPHPRKPGAVFVDPEGQAKPPSPFAILAGLTDKT